MGRQAELFAHHGQRQLVTLQGAQRGIGPRPRAALGGGAGDARIAQQCAQGIPAHERREFEDRKRGGDARIARQRAARRDVHGVASPEHVTRATQDQILILAQRVERDHHARAGHRLFARPAERGVEFLFAIGIGTRFETRQHRTPQQRCRQQPRWQQAGDGRRGREKAMGEEVRRQTGAAGRQQARVIADAQAACALEIGRAPALKGGDVVVDQRGRRRPRQLPGVQQTPGFARRERGCFRRGNRELAIGRHHALPQRELLFGRQHEFDCSAAAELLRGLETLHEQRGQGRHLRYTPGMHAGAARVTVEGDVQHARGGAVGHHDVRAGLAQQIKSLKLHVAHFLASRSRSGPHFSLLYSEPPSSRVAHAPHCSCCLSRVAVERAGRGAHVSMA